MKESLRCNLCDKPGTLDHAKEVAIVNCHVGKFKDDKFTVWRCSNCSSLHSKEVVDLPKYYADYPFKNQTLDFHTKVAYANRIKLLKKLGVQYNSSIIDYGCGKGLYVDYLKSHGFANVTGFDPYSERFSDASVLNNKYDVVVSHDVIEHVDEPREFLDAMISLSKQKGLVVIGTPNASEIKLEGGNNAAVELSQPYHRHILSESALLNLTNDYGFKPVQVYRRFYFDSPIPGVNVRFMWAYLRMAGGLIDSAVEPFRWKMVLTSPYLIFLAFFGYYLRWPGNILITFRNFSNESIGSESKQKQVING